MQVGTRDGRDAGPQIRPGGLHGAPAPAPQRRLGVPVMITAGPSAERGGRPGPGGGRASVRALPAEAPRTAAPPPPCLGFSTSLGKEPQAQGQGRSRGSAGPRWPPPATKHGRPAQGRGRRGHPALPGVQGTARTAARKPFSALSGLKTKAIKSPSIRRFVLWLPTTSFRKSFVAMIIFQKASNDTHPFLGSRDEQTTSLSQV